MSPSTGDRKEHNRLQVNGINLSRSLYNSPNLIKQKLLHSKINSVKHILTYTANVQHRTNAGEAKLKNWTKLLFLSAATMSLCWMHNSSWTEWTNKGDNSLENQDSRQSKDQENYFDLNLKHQMGDAVFSHGKAVINLDSWLLGAISINGLSHKYYSCVCICVCVNVDVCVC